MVEPTRIFVLPAAVCSAHEEVNKLHQCLLDDSLITHDALEIITLMTMLVYGTDSVHAQLLHGVYNVKVMVSANNKAELLSGLAYTTKTAAPFSSL